MLRLQSAVPNLVLFSSSAAAAANPNRFIRFNQPLRSLAFIRSFYRRAMDPQSPSAASGVDDFVHVEEGDSISEGNHETSPENEGGSDGNYKVYERKVLPPELSKSTVTLTCDSTAEGGVCDVYLVGTAHVSKVN